MTISPERTAIAQAAAQTMRTVRDFIRAPYAWPGGYPVVLFMADGETMCRDCARSNYRQISADTRAVCGIGWRAEGTQIHWEGAPETCCECGAETASAYGDPDADERDAENDA